MLSAARRPLMEIKFHTPRKVPGKEHEQEAAGYEEDQQTRELQFAGAGALENLKADTVCNCERLIGSMLLADATIAPGD